MLIYNYKKEFIGIDEKHLKVLGLENLAQLRSEAADIADLFVRTPGYIHNFKHVHWIDYITCADSSEQPKVVINVNNNLFKADINITVAYLADNPMEKAFLVNLNHLRVLTDAEKGNISKDLLERPTPVAAAATNVDFNVASVSPTTSPSTPVVEDVVEDEYDLHTEPDVLNVGDLSVDDVIDDTPKIMQEEPAIQKESTTPTPVIEDIPLDVDFALDLPDSIEIEEPTPIVEEIKPAPTPKPTPQKVASTPTAGTELDPDLLKILNSGYVYEPQIASDELGLPLDLIEEFIEDFINQAKEFKDGLYTALDEGDTDNVKILSHKLKGVAANLRIEDALEVLTTINTTSDLNIIKKNLDIFYILIAKLSGEEIDLNNPTAILEPEQEEELVLDFKEDDALDITLESPTQEEITISDSDVPEQIELPELADDNFVVQDEIAIELDEEPLEIQPIESEPLTLEESPSSNANSMHYSINTIANDIGLDVESLRDLINDFQTESREILSTMTTALHNDDLNLAKAQARQLKGMSENLRLHEISSEVTKLIDAPDTQSALDELETLQTFLENISIED